MDPSRIADMLAALGAEPRVRAVRAMVAAGARGVSAGALAAQCGVSPSTMSFHLTQLRLAGLIESRRDGRTLFYIANLIALEALGVVLMRGLPAHPDPTLPTKGHAMFLADSVLNVLFLCTGNSARSLMAEVILNQEGGGRYRAFSAGFRPREAPHPETLATLRRAGYPESDLRCKDWNTFAASAKGAPDLDFVFTVCDDAAGEVCPTWPGQPLSAHWGVPDPVVYQGSRAATAAVFNDTFRMLRNRVAVFMALPFESLDRASLKRHVDAIGKMPRDPEATEAPPIEGASA